MNFESTQTTPVCEHLGIIYPIVQAGMGFVAAADLECAVCNPGGPPMRPGGDLGSHSLKEPILHARDPLDRPFGSFNLFCGFVADQAIRAPAGRFSFGRNHERRGP